MSTWTACAGCKFCGTEGPRCWRSECRAACYYPDACSETPPPSDAGRDEHYPTQQEES